MCGEHWVSVCKRIEKSAWRGWFNPNSAQYRSHSFQNRRNPMRCTKQIRRELEWRSPEEGFPKRFQCMPRVEERWAAAFQTAVSQRKENGVGREVNRKCWKNSCMLVERGFSDDYDERSLDTVVVGLGRRKSSILWSGLWWDYSIWLLINVMFSRNRMICKFLIRYLWSERYVPMC